MTEANFSRKLIGLFPREAHHQRIETSTGSGVPDMNVCHKGIEMWLELKVYTGGRVLIRREQHAWSLRRSFAGGSVNVVAWHPSSIYHVWMPPWRVSPHGKYLQIISMPLIFERSDLLINFLFT
jgi:hypothetical protein